MRPSKRPMKPKLLTTLKDYSGCLLIADIAAGITVALVALPLSIAIAIASGATPRTGNRALFFMTMALTVASNLKIAIAVGTFAGLGIGGFKRAQRPHNSLPRGRPAEGLGLG